MPVNPNASAALQRSVRNWASNVMNVATQKMPDQMRPYAPIGKSDTAGELRAAIQTVATVSAGSTVFERRIIAPVIQAKTTDQGSPAHWIRPTKRHGLLVFEIGGVTVFNKGPIFHPGNAAHPWWSRALEATWGPNLRYAALSTPFT